VLPVRFYFYITLLFSSLYIYLARIERIEKKEKKKKEKEGDKKRKEYRGQIIRFMRAIRSAP